MLRNQTPSGSALAAKNTRDLERSIWYRQPATPRSTTQKHLWDRFHHKGWFWVRAPAPGRGVKNTVGLVLKKISLFYGFWSQCNVRKQAVGEKWEISDVVRSILSSTVTLETFACSEEKRARSQSLDSCRFPSCLHKLCMKLPSFYTAEKNPNHPRCHCSERRKKGGVPLNERWLNPVMLNRAATTGENNLVLLQLFRCHLAAPGLTNL